MNTTIIDFDPEGTVQAMHRDGFPLGFLGPQTIARASDIRFNEETQRWDLYIMDKGEFRLPVGGEGFEGYDIARKVEVQWLDHCRLHSFNPFTINGLNALIEIRNGTSTS